MRIQPITPTTETADRQPRPYQQVLPIGKPILGKPFIEVLSQVMADTKHIVG